MESLGSFMFIGVLLQAIWLVPAALQLMIGIYVNKNFKSGPSTLVFIGGIMAMVLAVFNIFMNHVLIREFGYGENIQFFFYAKSFIDFIAQFMFFYGVFQLFKHIKEGRFSDNNFNPKASNPFFVE